MSFTCVQGHAHPTDGERIACEARYLDSTGLLKMAQVNFAGPKKIPRIYERGRKEQRGNLEVTIFSEEEIVPWHAAEEDVDTDPGLYVPEADDEEIDDDEEPTDPRAVPPRKP